MYIQTYSVYLSYLKPCIVSKLPMAPIACPPPALHLKEKKNYHVHQSPHHNLLVPSYTKRASTRSGIVPGAKVHTALTHPSAVQSSWNYFLFPSLDINPLARRNFFLGSGKGACMKKRVSKGGQRGPKGG